MQFCANSQILRSDWSRTITSIGVLLVITGLISCGGNGGQGGGGSSAEPTSLTVTCTPTVIFTNQTSACVAVVKGTGSSDSSVVWNIVDQTMGSLSQSGLFTPARAGTVTIYAGINGTGLEGSATITINNTAPSNLVYPKTKITANVGEFVQVVPSVVGVVEKFSVSPQLPDGLRIVNSMTGPCGVEDPRDTILGSICGTPKAVSPETVYTVTASNSSGSTSTTLGIAVRVGAPSYFAYPLATINASVGEAIPSDIPAVTGTVDAFSVAPALPAGLILNTATGTISGTPTAVTPQVDYVVTATNSNGGTDSTVTISVAKSQNILLELGHDNAIQTLRLGGGHMLSADSNAHWALWDYSSGALLASGDGIQPFNNCNSAHNGAPFCPQKLQPRYTNVIDMAGQIYVVTVPNGLEIHGQSDGHLISLIVFHGLNLFGPDPVTPSFDTQIINWWQLASDGSYVSIGSQSGLFVFTPQGQLVLSKAGDYSSAIPFSAPDAVRLANGHAGAKVIESISIPDGTSTVSPAFSGDFSSWFTDGGRFLTQELSSVMNAPPNTVFVYSKAAGAQEAAVHLPSTVGLGGEGNWIWTYDPMNGYDGYPFEIYAVGSETPALSLNAGGAPWIGPSASTLGFVSSELVTTPSGPVWNYKFNVVDLSGTNPVKTDFVFPVPYATPSSGSYAAISASQWVLGNIYGAIVDGSSPSSTPKFFGYGEAWSIAGSKSNVAISTAIGKILIFDPYAQMLEQTIDFSSGKVALSADGSVLDASAYLSDQTSLPDRTLKFYSLPSGTLTSSFPYAIGGPGPNLFDFTLSASGTTMGRVTGVFQQSPVGGAPFWVFSRQVSGITGGAIWSDTPSPYNNDPYYIVSPLLSPDGTLIAATLGPRKSQDSTTSILKAAVGGIASIPGVGVGWIDDDRFLVNRYLWDVNGLLHYVGCSIYSAEGALFTSPSLPELKSIQPITADTVYDPSRNTIYSLITGQPVWTGSYPISLGRFTNSTVGAVAGTYVVYKSGHRVVMESF